MELQTIMELLKRIADAYGVPFDEALDIWVEVDGNIRTYEEQLSMWSKEL